MKLPQAWITAGTKKPTEQTARIDMSADVAGQGNCPECKEPMTVVASGSSKLWVCIKDRISLPMPDGL